MNVCKISSLHKSFGQNHVLRGIDLELNSGEILVLMGANGAGKSTLVKVLCGFHQADGGQIELAGQPFAPLDASDALSQGVVTVHQSIDDGVIPDLDVATNLMLDRLTRPGAGLMVRDRHLRREARKVAESMGLKMDVRSRVADLAVADRQMIAIARAMARAPKVLILDEPTSSLSAAEADRLFALIDRLKTQGVAILYISHRMSDIRRIADRIVCMRDGAISGNFDQSPLDYDAAVTAMLGHRMTDVDIDPVAGEKPVLSLRGIPLQMGQPTVSLEAKEGEVLAITGLLGSGKSKLADTIFGILRAEGGEMQVDGAPYAPRSVADAMSAGVFMSSKDRSTKAVIPAFDIANNMSLPFLGAFSRMSLLSPAQQTKAVTAMIDRLGIVCQSSSDGIGTLSGGNQQKVMIGRWLMKDCRVLVLDEPFQGVDIGARRDIGRHIRATANSRATIVFVSEIDEAFEIADRILVLHEGKIVGEHRNENVDLDALIAQVSGASAPNQMAGAQ